jgi:tetratricopeptide (TPR) repeat protein
MAVVDPYSPCPCGSGKKFKWCCHKVESYAERAQRLLESGQADLALAALNEGLRKEPGNAWLLTRKAMIQLKGGQGEEAKATVREVLRSNPKHVGALVLMTRLVLETEGPRAGAAQFQQALSAFPLADRMGLAPLARLVGVFLTEAGDYPAALRHVRLAQTLSGGAPEEGPDAVGLIESRASASPWLKNDDALSPAPEGLSGESRDRFAQALGWAGEGLWSSAAAAFETLTSDPVAGPAAERNAGFCRLWLADDAAATAALRRYAARLGTTEEAVDLEALCQQIDEPDPDDQVEHVQLTWPLRDRPALLDALKAEKAVHPEGVGPLDPDDPESPEIDQFALLDRPQADPSAILPADGSGLTVDQVPRVLGRVFVGADSATLEAFDDGRLDGLSERFTTLAGPSLAPAHPRTKVLEKASRLQLAMTWEWLLPDGVSPENAQRLSREFGSRLVWDVWPNTRMRSLSGRTPAQAAEAGDAEVPLRALVFQLEHGHEPWREGFDFAAFRNRLRIPAEPEVNPATVDVHTLHLARLALVPADRLDDERLVALYARARRFMMTVALERAARALADRPQVMERNRLEPLTLYTDLATLAAAHGRRDEALDWARRGRAADPAARRSRNALGWDMLELRLRAVSEQPEQWVPELAVVLDRYGDDKEASESLMVSLIEMGLVQVVQSPERRGEIYLDTRPLQALVERYGPRVTTAGGRVGVSATKPGIWTPGSEAGTSGGIWTPGSTGQRQGGGGKNLIIPGR